MTTTSDHPPQGFDAPADSAPIYTAKNEPPHCPYCGTAAERAGGDVIYPHRKDLAKKVFWRCPGECAAHVGCHPGTDQPLGRLANQELRLAKRAAHAAFDPLWRDVSNNKKRRCEARDAAYAALAKELGITRADAHIGMFDVELCQRTVAATQTLKEAISK